SSRAGLFFLTGRSCCWRVLLRSSCGWLRRLFRIAGGGLIFDCLAVIQLGFFTKHADSCNFPDNFGELEILSRFTLAHQSSFTHDWRTVFERPFALIHLDEMSGLKLERGARAVQIWK